MKTFFWLTVLTASAFVGSKPLHSNGPFHDFFVSNTTLRHNAKTQSVEVTIHFFSDDLERAVSTFAGKPLNLGEKNESKDAHIWISKYLSEKMRIQINGKTAALRFLGKESGIDATWCYAEISGIKQIKNIQIANTFFIELIEKQTNIVQLENNNQKKSLLFDQHNTTGSLSF